MESFPSLSPIGSAQSAAASNPAKRVLVIKSGNTRRGGTQTKTSKTNVWDKVAHAAAATPVTRQVTPPSSRPESPARNVNMTKTAWSTGGGSSQPSGRRPASPTPVVRKTHSEFPSLPVAPPKHPIVANMRRSNSGGEPFGRGWGQQESNSGEDVADEEEPKASGKKSKKKGKQVLFRVGL